MKGTDLQVFGTQHCGRSCYPHHDRTLSAVRQSMMVSSSKASGTSKLYSAPWAQGGSWSMAWQAEGH